MAYILFLWIVHSLCIVIDSNQTERASEDRRLNVTTLSTLTSSAAEKPHREQKDSAFKVIGLRVIMMCIIIVVLFSIGLGVYRVRLACNGYTYKDELLHGLDL